MLKKLYTFIISILSFIYSQDLSGFGSLLLISPSAKATSLGNTMHSVIESPAALFFNPANLGFTNNKSFYANANTNDNYYGNYNSFGFLAPIGQVNIGVAVSQLTIDEIEEYNSEAVYQGNFNSSDLGLIIGMSYSHKNMSWGISSKYMKNEFPSLETDKSEAYGIDIGFTSKNSVYRIPLIVGFNINRSFANIDGKLSKEYVPSRVTLGLKSLQDFNVFSFSPHLDIVLQESRVNTLNWGISADYRLNQMNLSKVSLFFGQKGYYLENSSSIEKSELNQIPKRFNLGVGGQLKIGTISLSLDYSHNISDYYMKRNFITISMIF